MCRILFSHCTCLLQHINNARSIWWDSYSIMVSMEFWARTRESSHEKPIVLIRLRFSVFVGSSSAILFSVKQIKFNRIKGNWSQLLLLSILWLLLRHTTSSFFSRRNMVFTNWNTLIRKYIIFCWFSLVGLLLFSLFFWTI